MHGIRKFGLILLFLWFLIAVVADLFGIPLFFPFSIGISGQEEMFRLYVIRLAVGCLLLLIIFRYLCQLRPWPSLIVVYWYAIFFIISSCIYAVKMDIKLDELHYLIWAVIFSVLIRLEIRQKVRETRESIYKRDYF
jgi:hypothetical protein